MNARLALIVAFLLCVTGFGSAATLTVSRMVDAVNEKLPENEQFDHFWWDPSKVLRLKREYRRLYPEGKLLRRQAILIVLMWLSLVVIAELMGFGFFGLFWLGGGGAFLLWLNLRNPSRP